MTPVPVASALRWIVYDQLYGENRADLDAHATCVDDGPAFVSSLAGRSGSDFTLEFIGIQSALLTFPFGKFDFVSETSSTRVYFSYGYEYIIFII